LRGLNGLTDPLLQAHVKLYEGYVKNVNLLQQRIAATSPGTLEWSEMKRRMGFELNGLRLHELYFESLGPGEAAPSRALEDVLVSSWGSYSKWREEFEAVGHMRGVGWAILYRDPVEQRFSNHWIALHEEGHPAGFTPLLAMDVWEHAFTGMDRSSYIEAFFRNVRWTVVEKRLSTL
jgi:Fe-Mn family superoxide dismutase